jgi:hypothetical protein
MRRQQVNQADAQGSRVAVADNMPQGACMTCQPLVACCSNLWKVQPMMSKPTSVGHSHLFFLP